MIRENRHLKGIKITDRDDKPQLPIHVVLKLPIHVVLEASAQGSKLRQNHEWAIAEMTKMGWFITSPGKEFDQSTMLLTQESYRL